MDSYEREKRQMQLKLGSLQQDLATAPSPQLVETMRRELRILKRLEYNADTDQNPEIAGNQDDVTDLESVLVSKLKKAESELVTERVSRDELEKECTKLQAQLKEMENTKKEQEKLLASLEADLARAIAARTPPQASPALLVPQTENSDILQSVLEASAERPSSKVVAKEPVVSKKSTEQSEDDHSVATIVMAQRDRLRARCEALEAERDSFKRELQAQVSASDSLKADNTKLYEKVRYLQNFSSKNNRGFKPDHDMDLEALEQRYEASVDPFRQFSRAERQRKLNEMPPMERTVFVVAKTVLGTSFVAG
jgi:homeobox protein cut-like